MSTSFISAIEYYQGMPAVTLGKADIGEQPASTPAFHFGQQPAVLKNVDHTASGRRQILVLGAGDVWRKFCRWALEHRGTEYFVYDPAFWQDDAADKPDAKTAAQALAGVDEAHCLRFAESDTIPAGIDCVLILTPPRWHAQYIQWAQEHHLPAMVEKPLVTSPAEVRALDSLLAHATAPVYCMDWEIAHATALAAVLGRQVPFSDTVHCTHPDRFTQFDVHNIASIEATLVETGDPHSYGNMDYLRAHRPWIFDYQRGGGALYDMGVHPLNALAAMGFMPGAIQTVLLGDASGTPPFGVYRAIGNGEATAEWYARVQLQSTFNGQTIPTLIEVAKAAAASDMRITLTDHQGHVLHWEYGHETSTVTLWPEAQRQGVPLARAVAHIDPYALMFEEADRFFRQQQSHPGPKIALYYPEQAAVLEAIARMHEQGRARVVHPTDTVTQLALAPPRVVG